MPTDKDTLLTLKLSPQSILEIQTMAKEMNTDVAGVISQALALLKVSQGKIVILKERTSQTTMEIRKYSR